MVLTHCHLKWLLFGYIMPSMAHDGIVVKSAIKPLKTSTALSLQDFVWNY